MVGLSGPIELWAPVGPYRMVGNLRPRSLAYRNQNNGVPYKKNGGGQIIVGWGRPYHLYRQAYPYPYKKNGNGNGMPYPIKFEAYKLWGGGPI